MLVCSRMLTWSAWGTGAGTVKKAINTRRKAAVSATKNACLLLNEGMAVDGAENAQRRRAGPVTPSTPQEGLAALAATAGWPKSYPRSPLPNQVQ